MKKFRLVAAAAAVVALNLTAHATQPTPQPSPVNAASARAGALALAGSASLSTSTSTSAGGSVLGSGNGTAQVLGSGNSSNMLTAGSAIGGTGGAGGSLELTGARFGSDVRVERSAPGVSVQAAIQVRNCRVGIGFGGSGTQGSASFAIPLANDKTCLAGAKLEAMQAAGGFSVESRQKVACEIEGMDTLRECKALADGDRAEAILNDRPAVSTSSAQQRPMPWQAGG